VPTSRTDIARALHTSRFCYSVYGTGCRYSSTHTPAGYTLELATDPNHSIEPVIGLEPTATVNLADKQSRCRSRCSQKMTLILGWLIYLMSRLHLLNSWCKLAMTGLSTTVKSTTRHCSSTIMFCSGFMRKSKECLERVQDYTAVSIKPSVNQDNKSLLNIAVFMVGDLFTSLVPDW